MKKLINKVEYTQSSCFSVPTTYNVILGETPFVKVSIQQGEEQIFSEKCFLRDRQKFLKRFNLIPIDKWKNEYLNKNVLDGIQWELTVTYEDGTKKQTYGSNAYPKGYSRLKKLFEEIIIPEPCSIA